MDFMNLLKSVEALLYELVSWLVFYPITLWRCVRRPLSMFDYAQRELTGSPENQFADALSPPIFLFLSIALAHVIDTTLTPDQDVPIGLLSDTRNLLVFRATAFSLFPMILAVQAVRQKNQPLTRSTLRPAFYGHCFLAAPFVLSVDLALTTGHLATDGAVIVGTVIFVAGLIWYQATLTGWFVRHRGSGRGRAFARAALHILLGTVAMFLLVLLAVAPQVVAAWKETP
ncbi:MFS transporter permease [Aureimonas flava]|uniref:MFS transporter permease n=1 Tax=Aureimonas flava TaxID=2320271 RepID=A0A3A1WH16_9HYPH|nr:MFS transporter permease [Aureimonas flava]RIX99089.1 MFS transporter permease [Aureimonas flava]